MFGESICWLHIRVSLLLFYCRIACFLLAVQQTFLRFEVLFACWKVGFRRFSHIFLVLVWWKMEVWHVWGLGLKEGGNGGISGSLFCLPNSCLLCRFCGGSSPYVVHFLLVLIQWSGCRTWTMAIQTWIGS